MAFNVTNYLGANKALVDLYNSDPNLQKTFGSIENFGTSHWTNYGSKGGWATGETPAVSAATPASPPIPGTTPTANPTVQVVPGTANPAVPNQMNVADYGGQIIGNPSNFFSKDNPATANVNESMFLKDQVPSIDANAAGTNINGADPKYAQQTGSLTAATAGPATGVPSVTGGTANTYDVKTTIGDVSKAENQVQAATGTVNPNAIIKAPTIDTEAIGKGQNEVGKALNASAQQGMSNVIDTSTAAGKLLAQSLGEGNYVDSKATMLGQMELLSKEFVDEAGNPKIPTWAAATARGVSKIAAFGGLTGSAATAVMSQAILEASLPMAQADATFYQTLTVKNLDNRQEATINKANVLSKMELSNLDSRLAAAVQNSKNFMDMDLANLSNEQQARVINSQSRVQSILEDAKQTNAQRLFTAQSQNDMDMFYDQLNTNINQFNATQINQMKQFDADQINSVGMFNAQMETNRQQFYQSMQYNIDVSNAKWRQTVTTTNAAMAFEAASTDVKNMVGVSVEQLNQLWDRSDSILDYVWKSSESDLDRKQRILELTMANQNASSLQDKQLKAADKAGLGNIAGTVIGGIASTETFTNKLTGWLFG